MCSVREKGEGHRGFRAGVLTRRGLIRTPMWRGKAACILSLSLLAASALISCGKSEAPAPARAADPRSKWYQIQEGAFVRIPRITDSEKVLPQPWTIQTRIADAAFIGNAVVFAVNGSGLAAMNLEGNEPAFASFYDSLIFAHRTTTSIVRTRTGATVHVYFNQMLNTVGRSALPMAGISLVGFVPDSGEYTFIIPAFQRRNTDWEAVGFVAAGVNDYFFEWKQSGETETRFGYTRFNPDTGTETAVARSAYIDAYRLSAAAAPGGALRSALFARCRRELAPGPSQGVHFSVRSREDVVKRVFRTGEGVSSITTIPVWEEKALALALLPGGRVVRTTDGAAFDSFDLPPLPEGFRYTDLLKTAGTLILPWEQVLFTEVRAAGILIYTL